MQSLKFGGKLIHIILNEPLWAGICILKEGPKGNQGVKHNRQPDQGDDRSIHSDPAMWLDACVYRVLMMPLEWLKNATRAACAKVICPGEDIEKREHTMIGHRRRE